MHKTARGEVYTTVPVEITTKEDAWSWDMECYSGVACCAKYMALRVSLRFGFVDGEFVNGIIATSCPKRCTIQELGATAAGYYADVVASRCAAGYRMSPYPDFLLSSSQGR